MALTASRRIRAIRRRQRLAALERVQKVIRHCRRGFDHFVQKTCGLDGPRYTLEPDGKFVPQRCALEAIATEWMVACDVDLFGDASNAQRWVARVISEEELMARAFPYHPRSANPKESDDMNMTEFLKASYVTVKELNTKGRISGAVVVSVQRSKRYDKPEMVVTVNGLPRLVGLNKQSLTTLCQAWGVESDGWTDNLVDIDLGTAQFNDDDVDSIVVEPSPEPAETEDEDERPAPPKKRAPKPSSSSSTPVDDQIPFCPQTE